MHTLLILVLREVGCGLATSFLLISVPAGFGGDTLGSSSGQLCLRSLSVNLRIRFRDGFMIPNQLRGWPPEVIDMLVITMYGTAVSNSYIKQG